MKKIVFAILFATLFVACNNVTGEDNPVISPNVDMQEEPIFNDNRTFTINGGGSTIVYQSRIGYDFDSALDSLIRRYEPILNTLATEGHYSGEGFNIDKERINVNFSYDNRAFVLLTFADKVNIYQILFSGDVIDEKGNYYRLRELDD